MNRGYPEVLLTLNFHIQVRKWQSRVALHLKFGPRQSTPKMTKRLKKCPKWPFFSALMSLNSEKKSKLCLKLDLERFGTKNIIKDEKKILAENR